MEYQYRWLTNDEIEEWVQPVLRIRGWALLNINDTLPTCRVKGAFEGPELIGFIVLQFFPMIGPEWVDNDHRDGSVARELAQQMHDYMVEVEARGALTVCETPISERLAIRHGMKKLEAPVYIYVGAQ